jgi:hypothetical protein
VAVFAELTDALVWATRRLGGDAFDVDTVILMAVAPELDAASA